MCKKYSKYNTAAVNTVNKVCTVKTICKCSFCRLKYFILILVQAIFADYYQTKTKMNIVHDNK